MNFFNVHKLQITDSVNYTYRIADIFRLIKFDCSNSDKKKKSSYIFGQPRIGKTCSYFIWNSVHWFFFFFISIWKHWKILF